MILYEIWLRVPLVRGDEEKQQLLKVAEATLSSELEEELDRISDDDVVLQQRVDETKSKLGKELDA